MNINTDTTDEALRGLWAKTLGKSEFAGNSNWHIQQICVASYGVGMEEALDYLYANRPDFENFLEWIANAGILPKTTIPYEEDVLSENDRALWDKNGYIVIPNAVPAASCQAARNAIWEYLQASSDDQETWYRNSDRKRGMMLRLFQHEALTQIRYAPKIRKVYEELYKTKDIFLVVDKVSFNPPEAAKYRFAGSPLHWDVSLKTPIPFELQGFVYLTDTRHDEGAFHCVPGFHKSAESWLSGLPAGTNPRDVAPEMLSPIAVPGNAGDLVIWHQALPHCATPNLGKTPRMVQYVAYKPLEAKENSEWI